MIAENLNKAIIAAGNPSNKVIAEKAHCSVKTVSSIRSRKNEFPDTYTLNNIAGALGTTLAALLVGTNTAIGDVEKLEAQITSLNEEIKELKHSIQLLEKDLAHDAELLLLKDELISLYRIKCSESKNN